MKSLWCVAIGCAWALGACAQSSVATQLGHADGDVDGDAYLENSRRVTLVVSNNCGRPIHVYILRTDVAPTSLGPVPVGSARAFDVTRYARPGSEVLVGAGDGLNAPQVFSEPVKIVRPGSVVVSIAPPPVLRPNTFCAGASETSTTARRVSVHGAEAVSASLQLGSRS